MSLLRTALFIAGKDLRHMLRARETLLWTFFMPIVFFFFIGTITGGQGGFGGAPDPLAYDRSPEAGYLADLLAERLGTMDFRLVPAESVAAESRMTRLTVPAGFTDSVTAGRTATLTLTRRGASLSGDYARIRVQRAAWTLLGDLVAVSERGDSLTRASVTAIAETPKPLKLEVRQAGRRREIPSGFEQAVPGTMVMFTLLVLLTSGSILLVIERRDGLLRRLASSPLPRTGIILGKWAGRLGLGAVQLGFAMLAGTFLFHMRWGPHVGTLFLVLLVYGSLVAMLGILLGNLSRSEGQAAGIGVLSANVLAALGGCWWPIEITPPWMQKLSLFLPTGLAMDALHKLVSFGAPPAAVAGHLAALAAGAVVIGWIAVRTFRFQ